MGRRNWRRCGTMTKAEKILALAAQGLSTREIAIAVYGADCNIKTKMAYTRIVMRQRNNGMSAADRRYWKTDKGRAAKNSSQRRRKKLRRATDPVWHDKEKAYRRAWYARHKDRLQRASNHAPTLA